MKLFVSSMNVRPRILTGCNLDGSLPKKSFTCLFCVWKCFNRSVYKHLSSLTVLVVFYHVPKLRQKREASVLQGHAKKKMEELQSRAESAQASLDKAGFWEIEGTGLSRSGPRCRLSRKWMTLIVVQLPFPCWNRRAAAWIFIEALLEKSTMADGPCHSSPPGIWKACGGGAGHRENEGKWSHAPEGESIT